mmetsp:Transcript_99196/g.289479  ORF Transcript_99196/g.289479 Transcript_99196/m.289479 type:complete len:230 (+) Transcript_99196:309-998(+)
MATRRSKVGLQAVDATVPMGWRCGLESRRQPAWAGPSSSKPTRRSFGPLASWKKRRCHPNMRWCRIFDWSNVHASEALIGVMRPEGMSAPMRGSPASILSTSRQYTPPGLTRGSSSSRPPARRPSGPPGSAKISKPSSPLLPAHSTTALAPDPPCSRKAKLLMYGMALSTDGRSGRASASGVASCKDAGPPSRRSRACVRASRALGPCKDTAAVIGEGSKDTSAPALLT